jgi:hypothetical protein
LVAVALLDGVDTQRRVAILVYEACYLLCRHAS